MANTTLRIASRGKNVSCDEPRAFEGRFVVRRLGLATINLYTTYEVSMLSDYEDMKGDEKCKNWGGLGG